MERLGRFHDTEMKKKNNKTIDIEAMRERGTMASSDAGMLWGFLLRPMRNIFFFFL